MPQSIRIERARERPAPAAGGTVSGRVLLPGEVSGITIRHCIAEAGERIVLGEEPGVVMVRVFLRGSARLAVGPRTHLVEEIAVLATTRTAQAVAEPLGGPLEFLEIARRLEPSDEQELAGHAGRLPYFLLYSESETYSEAVKSEKTVSRTLVPADLLPRFSMGSVQTTGPDTVGEHRHPMLEQFFFGLPGNDCRVRADRGETAFSEDMLLHIPLGSLHSVHVEPGRALHYLWLDFFMRQEDTDYISRAHTPIRR